ncbi:bifunctional hydroxymethylpyrimidine kinase/phosphomethylpyrimidine kinase [Sneathiella glossodoripedis]|uniref:bifunctional hydroxymethylpyrimidine kinase/phosphomethylpyrimidine kinase n=1 Tax=Sneathiella glossodoripedis TaxID=418853 RepID=UPI000472ED7B|nr:bifunctional hydroxymethylpyrimidine kinase/phosphomethylpyrimidine kinase [Sneathiella glossodoripedis]
MKGRVLTIAGSDSGGGAGIQADLKAITALGGFGASALTALTSQNTLGVTDIMAIDPAFVVEQIRVVKEDIGLDAIKIGMLHRVEVINAIADYFDETSELPPIVLDPVMIAKGGAALLKSDAEKAVVTRLVSTHTTLLTPNVPEAEKLVGHEIRTEADMKEAAEQLLDMGPGAVLLKGGHMEGPSVIDLLMTREATHRFEHPRIYSEHTHGTGCTLSSAIATGLAQQMSLKDSVERALRYVEIAIETAPGYGKGHGPLNHGHTVSPF